MGAKETRLAKLSFAGVVLLLRDVSFGGGLNPYAGFWSEDGVDLPENEGAGRVLVLYEGGFIRAGFWA